MRAGACARRRTSGRGRVRSPARRACRARTSSTRSGARGPGSSCMMPRRRAIAGSAELSYREAPGSRTARRGAGCGRRSRWSRSGRTRNRRGRTGSPRSRRKRPTAWSDEAIEDRPVVVRARVLRGHEVVEVVEVQGRGQRQGGLDVVGMAVGQRPGIRGRGVDPGTARRRCRRAGRAIARSRTGRRSGSRCRGRCPAEPPISVVATLVLRPDASRPRPARS